MGLGKLALGSCFHSRALSRAACRSAGAAHYASPSRSAAKIWRARVCIAVSSVQCNSRPAAASTHRRYRGALAAGLFRINLSRQLPSQCVLGLNPWESNGGGAGSFS